MSQIIKVQKFEEGGNAPNVNRGRRLTFKVNDQLIDMYEQDLNAEFENYKKSIGKYGKNVEDWNNDYNHLINKIAEGQSSGNYFDFKVGDASANSIKYGGESTNAERGLKDNGKTAKIGLLSGITGERNQAARNAALMDFLGSSLARSKKDYDQTQQKLYDDEQSKLKKEKDEADAKQKALTTDSIADSIGLFNFNKNFLSTALNGGDATESDVETLIRTYHKDPKQQANLSLNYLKRLQDLELSGKLSSEDARIAFNNGRTLDLKDVSNILRNLNLNDPKINYQSAFDSIGLGNEYRTLNDRSIYQNLLDSDQLANKKRDEALGIGNNTANGEGTAKTSEENTPIADTTVPDIPLINTFNFEGMDFDDFRNVKGVWNGVEKTFGEWEDSYLNSNRKSHPLEKQLYDSLYGPGGQLQRIYQDYLTTVNRGDWTTFDDDSLWRNKTNDLINDGAKIASILPGGNLASLGNLIYNSFGVGSESNYNPYRSIKDARTKLNVESFRDITDNFSLGAKDNQYRIVQEVEKDSNNIYTGGIPKISTKVIGPNGVVSNAKVQKGKIPGTYSLVIPSSNGRPQVISLGSYNPEKPNQRSRVQYANKYEFGGAVVNKSNKSTNVNEMFDKNYEITDADSLEIGALLADLTSFGATFVPGGGVVSGVAGLGSTVASNVARSKRGEELNPLGIAADIGLDLASAIPVAGSLAKTSKIVRAITKATPMLKKVLGAGAALGGGYATLKALEGISNGDYSLDNISTLTKGLTGLVTGKRILTDKKLAYKTGEKSGTTTIKVGDKDINVKLSSKDLDNLDGKNITDQKKIIQGLINKGKDTKVELDDIEFTTNKGWGRVGWKPSSKVEKSLDIKTLEGEKSLRTEEDFGSNPFIAKLRERAVKRQVKMNPDINPIAIDGKPKYNTGAITYSGMDRKFNPLPESRRLSQNAGPDAINNTQNTSKPFVKTQSEFRNEVAQAHEAANLRTGKLRTEEGILNELAKNTTNIKNKQGQDVKIIVDKTKNNLVGADKSLNWEDAIKFKKQTVEETSKKVTEIAKSGEQPKIEQIKIKKPKIKKPDSERVMSDKEIRNVRKSLGFNPSKQANINVEKLINPETKSERQFSNKVIKLAQNNKNVKAWLDREMLRMQEYSKSTPNINNKIYLKEGGKISKFQNSGKFNLPILKTKKNINISGKLFDPLAVEETYNINLPKYTATSLGDPTNNSDILNVQEPITKTLSKPIVNVDNNVYANVKSNLGNNPLYKRGSENNTLPVETTNNGFNVNKNDLSEWTRALANRRAHGMLDTRTSVALATAPTQVGMSIKGDLLGKSAFDTGASRIRQSAAKPLYSDAGVNLAGRLAGEAKANELEIQGGVQNANAIRQQELQQLQSDQQYSGIRAEVANRNAQALAAKEQADRTAKNSRFISMFKSIDGAWARQNALNYQKEARLQSITDQKTMLNAQNQPIGGTSKYADMTYAQADATLRKNYDDLSQQLETTTDPNLRSKLEKDLNNIKNEMITVQSDAKIKGLDTLLTAPRNGDINIGFKNFNLFKNKPKTISANKKGGTLSINDRVQLEDIRQNHKKELAWYKAYSKFIETKANNDARQSIASEKELSKLINKSLGGK